MGRIIRTYNRKALAARKFHFGGLDGWGYTLCNDFQSLGGQHRHLFDSAEDAHDELNHFFADTNPVEIDGFLAVPPHEHLLYLILHAYKHFVRSGIGL